MSVPPLRGRRTRDRRIAEDAEAQVNARRLARAAVHPGEEIDFDIAEVDAEVADAREQEERDTRRELSRSRAAAAPSSQAGPDKARPGRRIPDLAPLPLLLHDSGAFADLRRRL